MTPEELKAKIAELEKKNESDIETKVKAASDEAKAEMQKSIEAKEQEIKELKSRLDEIEAKSNDKKIQHKGVSLAEQLKGLGDASKPIGSTPIYLGLKATNDAEAEKEFKAAADITIPTLIPTATDIPFTTNTEVEAGLNEAPKTIPIIQNYVDMGTTGARTIIWVNKINEQGNAAWTAEGALKPLRSFQLSTEQSVAKKIAVRYRTSTETLEDRPTFLSELRADGFQELDIREGTDMLTGAESTTSIGGIVPKASAYNLTTVVGEDPDNYGAIRAAVAQIVSLNFRPNVALVNPIDAANMDLKKGANGQYVMPPFASANGQTIAGLQIVESNEIPVGYLLVGDLKKYHVRRYLGRRLDVGTDGNDFSENMRTVILEERMHAYVKSVDTGAFVYDTFSNIKAAIAEGSDNPTT